MARNGLLERRDVLSVPDWQPAIRLSLRQVADRIFASGKPIPKRIFVGHGVDDHAFLTAAAGCDGLKVSSIDAMGGWGRPEGFPFDEVRDVPVAELSVPLVDRPARETLQYGPLNFAIASQGVAGPGGGWII
ncbi:MAG: hypothetical protein H7Z12_15025 [Rhodospirillaceae bacterium]|nr:hypothetical protein [Rhodospirillales bacterium]